MLYCLYFIKILIRTICVLFVLCLVVFVIALLLSSEDGWKFFVIPPIFFALAIGFIALVSKFSSGSNGSNSGGASADGCGGGSSCGSGCGGCGGGDWEYGKAYQQK